MSGDVYIYIYISLNKMFKLCEEFKVNWIDWYISLHLLASFTSYLYRVHSPNVQLLNAPCMITW